MAVFSLGAGTDDFRWEDNDSFFTATGTALRVGDSSSSAYNQHSGWRFPGVNIAKSASIGSAYLTLRSQGPTGTIPTLRFYGVAADNPAAPTTYAAASGLALTTAFVDWTPSAWVSGTSYQSPDLSTIIQEIVNRSGWASGNALIIVARDIATGAFVSANAVDIDSFETTSGQPGTLTINVTGSTAGLVRNGAEGQTSGTAISAANSANSGDAFSSVVTGTGGTSQYTSTNPADGTMGFAFVMSAATINYVAWSLPTTSQSCTVEFCYYYDAAPATTYRIVNITTSTGTLIASVTVAANGKMQILNSAGTQIGVTTATMVVGHTYRVRLQVTVGTTTSNGTILMTYFDGAQNTTAAESNLGSSGAANAGTTQIGQARFGNPGGTSLTKTIYMDSLQFQNTSTAIGPYPTTPAAVPKPYGMFLVM